jgi:carbohydrate diacid regulator
MKLSQKHAMKIVLEINKIIEQKINIIAPDGTIIASSNEARIGTYHEGAHILVEQQLDVLIIHSDDDYVGARKGVNFPIIVNNEVLGVIGVTGPYEEVAKYGQIVKRVTEILLLEIAMKESKFLEEGVINRYIYEWLSGDNKELSSPFIERGTLLGIDITLPRRVLVMAPFSLSKGNEVEDLKVIEQSEEYMKRLIKHLDEKSMFMKSASYLVGIVAERNNNDLLKLATNIKKMVESKFAVKVAIGLDSENASLAMMHQSFAKARKAFQSSVRKESYHISFYEDLNMEIITGDISIQSKREYISRIFRNFNEEEIAEAIQILEIFYEEEGSIKNAAEKLFIHKNTLQYKLKKIMNTTGYDPRSISQASLFYLAIFFHKESAKALD